MRNAYKVAIIGGGASGLLCAAELLSGKTPFSGDEIIVLERNDRVGKKLVATGNGQGNFTNEKLCEARFHGERNFVSAFLNNASSVNLTEYFYDMGIPLVKDEEGRYYPFSKQASSALDIIRAFLSDKRCEIQTNCYIKTVKRAGKVYSLTDAENVTRYAEKIVLACGGCAAKQFGTDGNGYRIAEAFGHRITRLAPSLVQVKTETGVIRGLKGIKERVRLKLFDDAEGKNAQAKGEAVGDLLFTDYGVSGNTVFALSSRLSECVKPFFSVEFLPETSFDALTKILSDRANKDYIKEENVLTGIINKKTGQAILKNVKNSEPEAVASAIKAFRLNVTGTLGFDYAQVTKGGVDTDDINPFSMQSKLSNGLFFTGEIVNVDGDCGGFNLSFAFLSAIMAARFIKNYDN